MYRYVNEGSYNFEKLKTKGIIDPSPDTHPLYVTLDKFESATLATSKLQLPGKVEPTWVMEFQGNKIIHDIRFPKANFTKANYLEVRCRSFPDNGTGGGGQFITNSEIKNR